MKSLAGVLASHDYFLRRRDLLRLGFRDSDIRTALESREIFRVRHGWYSLPSAPEEAIEAVRVGGRLTGRSALVSYGIRIPHPRRRQIAVPAGACRLRRPTDRRARLRDADRCDIRWLDPSRTALDRARAPSCSIWRVSVGEAILEVLRTEDRDVAVACCDLALNGGLVSHQELCTLFDRAPRRARRWLQLVDGRAEAHGESFVRLWLGDAGITLSPQVSVRGVGRVDGRISARTFVEVDGRQHAQGADLGTTGDLSQFEEDRRRDLVLAIGSRSAIRFSYRLIGADWPLCLAAARQAVADDERLSRLEALDARHRKRRRRARESAERRSSERAETVSPSFSDSRPRGDGEVPRGEWRSRE